jgi:competence ComEA-like helix-hairpin-helix protein
MSPERLLALGVPIEVNRATASEWASLDEIGPRLAARIVSARDQLPGRRFRTLEDVARLRGVGPARLARLRSRLVLDGDGGVSYPDGR